MVDPSYQREGAGESRAQMIDGEGKKRKKRIKKKTSLTSAALSRYEKMCVLHVRKRSYPIFN